MERALKDVNPGGRTRTNVINLVKMVRMGLVASISAVETVRVITLVTKQLEPALNALLGGKIIIVTKLVMSDFTV